MTSAAAVPAPVATFPRLPATPLAVTAVGAVSAAGIGLDALGRAVVEGIAGHADPVGLSEETLPPRPARVVPELPVAELIGRKGTRHLDRTTKLALVACRLALDVHPGQVGERSGVVLGTSTGSIRSSSEFSLETLRQERPYLVNPSLFPNTVMNCAAGQIAIRHGLHGVNATIAGGHLSGVQALRYARNALRQGHADRILVGGVEEFCAQSAWGWHLSGALDVDVPVGEGAAMLMVEQEAEASAAGRPVLARVLACETGYGAPGGLSDALASVVAAALERCGRRPEEVGAVSYGATGLTGLDRVEERAVRAALGGRSPGRGVRVKETTGECFSAAGVLQIAGLIGAWRHTAASEGELALVTAVARDGNVGCAVLEAGSVG
ncbi:beta-ketoacyl synthase N-terminal-like domain-containing protein [Streptomyces sp. NPDC020192]|uniref:beta-ketoacyl synthase N-terminal-like domain-containing protein n=1 Tax=Streptomyces sp. NPDC020192 TaxID=3365066 RepID=UPI0037A93244